MAVTLRTHLTSLVRNPVFFLGFYSSDISKDDPHSLAMLAQLVHALIQKSKRWELAESQGWASGGEAYPESKCAVRWMRNQCISFRWEELSLLGQMMYEGKGRSHV